jgi:hypothetical protein
LSWGLVVGLRGHPLRQKIIMTKTKRITAGRRIAKAAFDPEARMAQFVRDAEIHAGFLNHFSKQAGLGVVAMVDKRRTFFKEEWRGALEAAEKTDEGMVGMCLRWMRDTGRFMESEQAQDKIEYRVRNRANSEIRKGLESVRGHKAVRQQEAALAAGMDEWVAMLKSVEAGNEFIHQSIKDDPDCRDIAPNWPLKLLNGLPIPIVEPHKTPVDAYQAPQRTRKPKGA